MADPIGSRVSGRVSGRAMAAILALTVGLLWFGPVRAASAQSDDDDTDADGWVTQNGGGVGVDQGSGGAPHGTGPGGTGAGGAVRPRRCQYYLQDSESATAPTGIATGAEVSIHDLRATAVVETLVWRVCTWLDTNERGLPELLVVPPSAALVARRAAERAAAELVLPAPVPHTNPPTRTLVNLPTWLWVDQQGVEQRSAATRGVTATVTAVPVRTTWQPGDDTTLDCAGPGTAYDTGRDAAHQRSACAHTYSTVRGRLGASVTQVWHLAWTATNGESGDLGEVARTTGFTVDVVELDTVLRNH